MIPAFRAVFESLDHQEVDYIYGEYCIFKRLPTWGLNMNGKDFWQYCVENNIMTHDLLRPLKSRHRLLLVKILRM